LFTGSGDNVIRVWNISYGTESEDTGDPARKKMRLKQSEVGDEEEEEVTVRTYYT
jgi:WD40 repeat protein